MVASGMFILTAISGNFDPTGLPSHLAHDAKSVIPQHKRFLFTAGTYKNMGIARY